MADTITFREVKLEEGWLKVKPERQDLGKAMAYVRKHKDRLYDLEIKEHREKRSLDANAYAWVLIHKLAVAEARPPLEVYRDAVRDVGNNYVPMCIREVDLERQRKMWESNGIGWQCVDMGAAQNVKNCRTVFAYYGSSEFDTAQMSRLIDSLIQDCKALGIETLPPDKLALLKEAWDA